MKGTCLSISSLMRLNTKSHRFASIGMIISCMFPFIFTAWWLVAIICIYEVAYTSGTPDECLRCGTVSLSPVDTPARHTSTTGCSVSLLPTYTLAAYAKVSELCNHITSRSTVLIRNDSIFAPSSTCSYDKWPGKFRFCGFIREETSSLYKYHGKIVSCTSR